MKHGATLSLALSAALIAAGCQSEPYTPAADSSDGSAAQPISAVAATDFTSDMQRLWEDHVAYTRLYIVSSAANLPDKAKVTERLLKNQDDIADALRPYYGDDAANGVAGLLKEHIELAAQTVEAAKAKDEAKVASSKDALYKNADEIAATLAKANTNWPESDLKSMMHEHLDLLLEEATARLQGDYAADIAAYDKSQTHIVKLARAISDGVMKQFPDKFSP